MLKNVKTSYFLRIIFSFTDERQKLKLIKYNKSLQENMNISLINYKIFSRKFIIYEQNGKGKEYDYKSKLIFEGEYLNGKKTGKGKEYDYNGKLIFEGEFINGVRNGKGKGYDYNGKLIYEEEYLNGKRWNGNGYNIKVNIEFEIKDGEGYIKEYDYDGNLKYEEYLNGKRNGKGKEYFNGKLSLS